MLAGRTCGLDCLEVESITLPRQSPFPSLSTSFYSVSLHYIRQKSIPNSSVSHSQNLLVLIPNPSHPFITIKDSNSTTSNIYQSKQATCLNQSFSTLTPVYVHIAFIPPASIPNHCFQGPNPWKVAIILEELGLKYETKFLDFPNGVKGKEYTAKNPNGR